MQGESTYCWKENKRLLERARDPSPVHEEAQRHAHFSHEEHPGREAVTFWLSALSSRPSSFEDRPLSKDLDSVKKAIAAIAEAEEAQILTEVEAEAVARFVLSKFVERRFDKALRELLNGSNGERFSASSWYFN